MPLEITLHIEGSQVRIDSPSGMGLKMQTPVGEVLLIGQPAAVEYTQKAIMKLWRYHSDAVDP